ncbi:phosphotransferase [soil metagenome]
MSEQLAQDQSPVVDRPDLLTPEWLTSAWRAAGHDVTVSDVRRTQVGTGQMGTSVRCEMTFAGDQGQVPASVVAKLPAPDVARRAMVAGIYRTEVAFYRELAPTVAVRTPTCHYSAISEDGCKFVLLLEDLAPAVQGDQIDGCDATRARAGALNLAGLHAPRWGDASLADAEWMSTIEADGAQMVGDIRVGATETFIDNYRDRLAPEDAELLRQLPAVLPTWILARPERFAPLHGDYRLDNLMFGPGDTDVAAVDWQTITLGLPARDLAYFLSTSLSPEDRRQHEDDLVADYHRALLSHGVTGHDLEQCFDDYRFGMLQGPLITIVGAAYGERTDRGDTMFLAMAARSCQAIRDLGTLELI